MTEDKERVQHLATLLLAMDEIYQTGRDSNFSVSQQTRLDQLGEKCRILIKQLNLKAESLPYIPLIRWLMKTEDYLTLELLVNQLSPQTGLAYYLGHNILSELFSQQKLIRKNLYSTETYYGTEAITDHLTPAYLINQQHIALTHALKAGDFFPDLQGYLTRSIGVKFQFIDYVMFSDPGINQQTFIDALMCLRTYNITKKCLDLNIPLESIHKGNLQRELLILKLLLNQKPTPSRKLKKLVFRISLEPENEEILLDPSLSAETISEIIMIAFNRSLELESIFTSVKQNIEDHDENGNTYLLRAIQTNSAGLLKKVLHHGALLDTCNQKQENALQIASHYTNESRSVITAAITFMNVMNGTIRTTVKNDNLKKLLKKGVFVGQRDKNQWTPLHWTTLKNTIDYTRFLIDQKADIYAKTRNGQTALDIALKNKNYSCALLLLQQHLINLENSFLPENVKNTKYTKTIKKILHISNLINIKENIEIITNIAEHLYQKNKLKESHYLWSLFTEKQQNKLMPELTKKLKCGIIIKKDDQTKFSKKIQRKSNKKKFFSNKKFSHKNLKTINHQAKITNKKIFGS